jgi:ubiquinone/menaquinone biosynthesis C-methylase UbiE
MSAARARSFDHMAIHFDRFAELVGGPLNEYLLSVLPQGGGQQAVDLGCGTGRHATLLASRYKHVVAIDISTPMLDFARARRARALPNITYQKGDLRRLPPGLFDPFDFVLSAYALHHTENLDQTLHSIRDLVAPGGRVVMIDNVAARPQVPRRWFIGEAIRVLVGDVVRRRRRLSQAWELFGLNVDPGWLDHLTSDRFLNPEQFAERYSAVFPGATFTDLYRARAICWDAPTR